jgi:catechol 2,3-dioxygenase-like lactoylglutathione lyase family enzyme
MGDALQAKIFFITLAVDDLDRSVAFYGDGSGWPAGGIVGPEVVRAAIGAGPSKSEVHRLAGMARTTIGRIVGALLAVEGVPR